MRAWGKMLNIPDVMEYPVIPPAPKGEQRPFWSVMIPTYHSTRYLECTLRSVLEQAPDPEKMQIEVVDDCSTLDDPEAVVKVIGAERVSFFRQDHNVGAISNFNTCIRRARGYWIHILHSDDMALPGFYQTYEHLISQYPDAAMLVGPSIHIDEYDHHLSVSRLITNQEGPVLNFTNYEAIRHSVRTPSVVISRSVYEQIGGYYPGFNHTADWELYFRAGRTGQVLSTVIPYSCYRVHPKSDTSHFMLSGQNIEEAIMTVEVCFHHLPEQVQDRLLPEKYYWVTKMAVQNALRLAVKKQWEGCLIQGGWAMKLCVKYFHMGWIQLTVRLILSKLRPTKIL